MKAQISNILSQKGLTTTDKILLTSIVLYPRQGVHELSRSTGVNPSQASTRLRSLAKLGLVVMETEGRKHNYRLA